MYKALFVSCQFDLYFIIDVVRIFTCIIVLITFHLPKLYNKFTSTLHTYATASQNLYLFTPLLLHMYQLTARRFTTLGVQAGHISMYGMCS